MSNISETELGSSENSTVYVQQTTEMDKEDGGVMVEDFRVPTGYKVFKSVLFTVTWICMGLYSGITGPTIPDLSERLGVDYDRVGFAIAFRSIGKMVGAVPSGYIRDRFNNSGDLLLGVTLSLVSLSVVTRPWAASVDLLSFLFFVEGCAHGGINCVGNAMCVLMWKEKAPLPVHFLHFGYGIGALLSPMIARPFLSHHITINVTLNGTQTPFNRPETAWNNVSETAGGFVHLSENITIREEMMTVRDSLIEIPYAIVAMIIVSVGILYIGLFLYTPSRRLTTMLGSTTYSRPCDAPFLRDRPKTALPILGLFFVYYMMTNAIDRALGSFLFTYAVESEIGFSKNEAAYLNTVFYACYGGGRFIIGLTALVLPIKVLLFSEVYLMAACSAVITFYGYDKRLFLWIFSCLLALFFGPIYPSGVAWVDRYVPLVGLVVAIFDVGDGTGAFIANWASGYLIVHLGPRSLLYFTFSAVLTLCVTIIIAQIIGMKRGDRHKAGQELTIADLPGDD